MSMSDQFTAPIEWRGRCPRCGGELDHADERLDRRCPFCRITVCSALVTFELTDDGVSHDSQADNLG